MLGFQNFIDILKKSPLDIIKTNESISDEGAYLAFSMIADGKANNAQIKKFLTLINKTGITKSLLFGAAKALNERSIKIKAPKNAIDVCGTGGDNSNSLNVSTTVAIILASMGVVVAKHGNKAVSSKSGSADIFSKLGININQSKEETQKSLKENNLAFIFAPLYHPAFKNIMPARKELGVRTIFNFLGPLLNPAQTKRQLIGCSDKKIAKIMAQTCILLKKEKCWIVTSEDKMDEISISANTIINKINKKGEIEEVIFNPEDYGIKKQPIELIKGKDPTYNASQLINLLKGDINDEKSQAYFDIVTLNCAAALIIADKFDNFKEAIEFTQNHIKSGKSYHFLQKLK